MKNSIKIGCLAMAIAVTAAACGNGDKAPSTSKINSSQTAIDTSKKMIDTIKKVAVDTTKKDATKKP